jgi:hypothetical protein
MGFVLGNYEPKHTLLVVFLGHITIESNIGHCIAICPENPTRTARFRFSKVGSLTTATTGRQFPPKIFDDIPTTPPREPMPAGNAKTRLRAEQSE